MDQHRQLLMHSGIPEKLIIPQICSGLAAAIEENPEGKKTRKIIYESVKQATESIDSNNNKVTLFHACTHYGYVKDIFEEYIKKEGFTICETFDPNKSMIENIYRLINLPSPVSRSNKSMVNLSIYSRCKIRNQEIKSITGLLSQSSPDTAQALTAYKEVPDLFKPF